MQTEKDIVEIASLIHHKWSESCKTLDYVKAEKDDGSPDWIDFHSDRHNAAAKDVDTWNGIRLRYLQENKDVINRAFGI